MWLRTVAVAALLSFRPQGSVNATAGMRYTANSCTCGHLHCCCCCCCCCCCHPHCCCCCCCCHPQCCCCCCCCCCAGMSYTATNLLYDMGPTRPVQRAEANAHWLNECSCFGLKSSSSLRAAGCDHQMAPTTLSSCPLAAPAHATSEGAAAAGPALLSPAASLNPPACRRSAAADSASSAFAAGFVSHKITTYDDVALTVDCDTATVFTAHQLAAKQSSQSAVSEAHSEVLGGTRSSRVGNNEIPPFLMYRWPRGLQGWCIIFLLIGQAGPCIAILTMLVVGQMTDSRELYFFSSGKHRHAVLMYGRSCVAFQRLRRSL
jgi:hypothetical protein